MQSSPPWYFPNVLWCGALSVAAVSDGRYVIGPAERGVRNIPPRNCGDAKMYRYLLLSLGSVAVAWLEPLEIQPDQSSGLFGRWFPGAQRT